MVKIHQLTLSFQMTQLKMDLLALEDIRNRDTKASKSSTIPRFYQNISYMGEKLYLSTASTFMRELVYYQTTVGTSILIPIDKELRQDLNTIENFVKHAVCLPKELVPSWPVNEVDYYRPLYTHDHMCITMGKYCKFTMSDGSHEYANTMEQLPRLQDGEYRFRIQVVEVYMGPHKNNKLYSLNLRVVGVEYMSLMDMAADMIIPHDEVQQEKEKTYSPMRPNRCDVNYRPPLKRTRHSN